MVAARGRKTEDTDLGSIETFLEETEERLDAITDTLTLLDRSAGASASSTPTGDSVQELLRNFHAIKGAGSFFGFSDIVQTTHESEGLLTEIRDQGRPLDQPIRRALADSVRSLHQLLRRPITEDTAPDSLVAQTIPLDLTERRRELLPYVVLDLEQTVQDAMLTLQDFRTGDRPEASRQMLESCRDLRNVLTYFGSATLECDLDAVQPAAECLAGASDSLLGQLLPRLCALLDIMLRRLPRLAEERDLLLPVDSLRYRLRALAEGRTLPAEAELPLDASLEDVYRIDGVLVRGEETTIPYPETSVSSPTQRLIQRIELLTENLSQLTQHPVRLVSHVEDSGIPADLLTALSTPLAQILRNCLDHGIEDASERGAAGKDEVGTITFSILDRDGQVELSVEDDGRGIDADAVAREAVERKLLPSEDVSKLSTTDKLRLILLPGLSTRGSVSTLSGRGVGMDIVATDLRRLGGSVTIESTPAVGSRIILRVPSPGARLWTFEIDGVRYGLPVEDVRHVCEIDSEASPSNWETEDGPIPRVSLCDLLTEVAGNATFAIILKVGDGEELALTVPLQPARERFPIQSLPPIVLHTPQALIRSFGTEPNGTACLILDPIRLAALVHERRDRAFRIGGTRVSSDNSVQNRTQERS